MTGIRDRTLIPNPHFQRRLVWSNAHKSAFIHTVLEGLPFPEVFISSGEVDPDTGEGQDLIVDGQQRITTIYQYFRGDPDLTLTDGALSPYKDLGLDQKQSFLDYDVVIRDLGQITEQETLKIFQRINSTSYSLNAMEVNNSRYDGELKLFAESLTTIEFFENRRVFTNLDVKRMNDIKFVLTVLISMMSGYFNRDAEHEPYLEKYNDEFPDKQDLESRVYKVIDLLEESGIPNNSRAWNKADLLNIFVELDRSLESGANLDPAKFGSALENFYDALKNPENPLHHENRTKEYRKRISYGSNDRTARFERGQAMEELIKSVAV